MAEQRQWTLTGRRMAVLARGPKLEGGESVLVVEAVLTDELVEKVARAVFDAWGPGKSGSDWDDWPNRTIGRRPLPAQDMSREGYRYRARDTLLAAGFSERPVPEEG